MLAMVSKILNEELNKKCSTPEEHVNILLRISLKVERLLLELAYSVRDDPLGLLEMRFVKRGLTNNKNKN